ncbi:ABC-type amino acid transport substrate-binding protein [Bradyrhizobium sp. LB9.1b]
MTKRTFLGAAVSACCLMLIAAGPASAADLLDEIMQAKKIRISTDVAIPPSGMMDASMKPTGSDVEVAQLLAKDWGFELEFIQTTGATRIPNVLTGKADIIISTLSVTPERAKVIDFTKRYATLQIRRRLHQVAQRQGLARPEGQDDRRLARHHAGHHLVEHEGQGTEDRPL